MKEYNAPHFTYEGLTSNSVADWENLMDTVANKFSRIAKLRGFSDIDCEDYTANAISKIVFNLPKIDPSINFMGWVNTVFYNELSDYGRNRSKESQKYVEASTDRNDFTIFDKIPDKSLQPDEQLILKEQLTEAISLLPPELLSCYIMSMQGLTYQEIGDSVNLSANAIKVKMWRTSQKIKSQVNDAA